MPFVKYISECKKAPDVKITASVNKGATWKTTMLKCGQSYPIAGNATNLLIDNVPYDPKKNYIIRNGNVAQS